MSKRLSAVLAGLVVLTVVMVMLSFRTAKKAREKHAREEATLPSFTAPEAEKPDAPSCHD